MTRNAIGSLPDGPTHRLLAGFRADRPVLDLAGHDALHAPLPAWAASAAPRPDLVDLVDASGLQGRGGASFPLARKLRGVASQPGAAVVVANGAEGEPASAKDDALLAYRPHLVLDGATVAAAAVGAERILVATGNLRARSLRAAVVERHDAGRDRIALEVVVVPDRFVSGQETAVVSFLNGGAGLPTLVPTRLATGGVDRRPTLVSNVETLAHLALIARYGPDWFRTVGTRLEPGSTLVTLRGVIARPGVYEIARGEPLADLVAMAGGGTGPGGPVLVGGYAGAWLSHADAARAHLDEDHLTAVGATLGAGVVIAFDRDECGLAVTAHILAYLAEETAGQCGPCVHGLAAMAETMHAVARGRCRPDAVERLENWAWQVTGRGACRHPDGAARITASALRVFRADLDDHVRGQPCVGSSTPRWHPEHLPAIGFRRQRARR